MRDTFDLKANRSSMDLFPAETWARIMRRKLSERDSALFETVPFNGLAELRRAIATQLYEFRGMLVSPDRIVIGAGTEYLYGRLLQLFGASCHASRSRRYRFGRHGLKVRRLSVF